MVLFLILLPALLFAQDETSRNSFTPEEILNAYVEAYPGIVCPVKDNPLAVSVRGMNFYFVEGRIVPEKENWEKFRPNMIYKYPKEIPDPLARTEEELNSLRERSSKSRRASMPPPDNRFYNLTKSTHLPQQSAFNLLTLHFWTVKTI